jgi:5-oxopent-3-ene-1,2,5-tricarboxylate decarboxylase / 2-hydroxyhepta-2,4-diene-1,7-dioate isomerase
VKPARVAYARVVHEAVAIERGLRLADGRVVADDQVVWLPPVQPGMIVAPDIHNADPKKQLAKEMTLSAKDEPLAFLKTPNVLVGHRGLTRRPADAGLMHDERELAVIIGRIAGKVRRADTMPQVAGCTIADDDAVRDYRFRSGPLITPKGARSSLQMLDVARAMTAHCAWIASLLARCPGRPERLSNSEDTPWH